MDRRRHLTQDRRTGEHAPAAVHERPVPQPAGYGLHPHPPGAPTSARRWRFRRNKRVLFGQQESRCNGCRSEFPFRILEVDHVSPQGVGGQDNTENLRLLCAHCNRVKDVRPQEYLVARLRDLGIPARYVADNISCVRRSLEVWPESHWPGFALLQVDVLQSYTA